MDNVYQEQVYAMAKTIALTAQTKFTAKVNKNLIQDSYLINTRLI
jgi:hypothetical protein